MMKLIKKIGIGLTATIMVLSPLLPNLSQMQTVLATKKKAKAKGKVTLLKNDYVYDKLGHKIKLKQLPGGGYKVPVNFTIDSKKGFVTTDADINDDEMANSYSYYGTKKINGQKYYQLANHYYLNEAAVLLQNKHNTKKNKLVLGHNSIVYNQNGTATGKKLPKNAIVAYQGKIKAAKKEPKYFFYEDDWARHLQIKYLPTRQIKKKQYYSLGRGHYINAANVSYINGHVARYHGTATATVLHKTYTTSVNYVAFKHNLKPGQKIKVDLTVIPYADDGFAGYLYRLHDHHQEYIDQSSISLGKNLPIVNYEDLIYTFVRPLSGDSVELYDTTGAAINKKIQKPKYGDLTVDGLMYLWVPSENKAELFYHCLNYDDQSVFDDQLPAAPEEPDSDKPTKKKLVYGNNLLKASDVKYISGLKLKPINSAKEAENDQKVASEADKQELVQLFNDGKNKYTNSPYSDLLVNYGCALVNASLVLRNNKVTVAQVKEAVWYIKTTITQFRTMSYPLGD